MSEKRVYCAVRLRHEVGLFKKDLFSRMVSDTLDDTEVKQYMEKEATAFFNKDGYTFVEMKILNEAQFLLAFAELYPPVHAVKQGVIPLYGVISVCYNAGLKRLAIKSHKVAVRLFIDTDTTDEQIRELEENIKQQCVDSIRSKTGDQIDLSASCANLEWCSESEYLKVRAGDSL